MLKAVTGGILTGGQARRLQELGPIDKGLVLLQQRPLVAWVAQTLMQLTQSPLLISANQNIEQYSAYGRVVLDPDVLPPFQGPLAGLWAMLEQSPTEWLAVLPVDTPFVPASLLLELWQAHKQQPSTSIFYMQHQRSYPLCLLVHRDVLPALQRYLLAGERRVQSWLEQEQAIAVSMHHHPAHSFFNINTPNDIESAQTWALDLGKAVD